MVRGSGRRGGCMNKMASAISVLSVSSLLLTTITVVLAA